MINKLKLPLPVTIENFIGVFTKEHFAIWLLNSLFITIVAMTIGSIIALLLSYGFSNFQFKQKKEYDSSEYNRVANTSSHASICKHSVSWESCSGDVPILATHRERFTMDVFPPNSLSIVPDPALDLLKGLL